MAGIRCRDGRGHVLWRVSDHWKAYNNRVRAAAGGTAFALLFGLLYVSLMFHRHIPVDLKANPRRGYLWFALSGITSASGVALLYFALSEAPVVVISPVVAISPLVSLTLAHLFLQRLEKITKRTIMGTLLVVLGVVIITLSRNTS